MFAVLPELDRSDLAADLEVDPVVRMAPAEDPLVWQGCKAAPCSRHLRCFNGGHHDTIFVRFENL